MRRERLRLQMKKAILSTLSVGHALSYVNVRRYVTRDRLTCFSIRLSTVIYESDWEAAIQLAREERVSGMSNSSRERELLEERKLKEWWKNARKSNPLTPPLVSTRTHD